MNLKKFQQNILQSKSKKFLREHAQLSTRTNMMIHTCQEFWLVLQKLDIYWFWRSTQHAKSGLSRTCFYVTILNFQISRISMGHNNCCWKLSAQNLWFCFFFSKKGALYGRRLGWDTSIVKRSCTLSKKIGITTHKSVFRCHHNFTGIS